MKCERYVENVQRPKWEPSREKERKEKRGAFASMRCEYIIIDTWSVQEKWQISGPVVQPDTYTHPKQQPKKQRMPRRCRDDDDFLSLRFALVFHAHNMSVGFSSLSLSSFLRFAYSVRNCVPSTTQFHWIAWNARARDTACNLISTRHSFHKCRHYHVIPQVKIVISSLPSANMYHYYYCYEYLSTLVRSSAHVFVTIDSIRLAVVHFIMLRFCVP